VSKSSSRQKRWTEAANKAIEGLEALAELQQEYEEWYDNMPENLQNGPTGEKLQDIQNMDLESALDTAREAEGADLPQGFGRD